MVVTGGQCTAVTNTTSEETTAHPELPVISHMRHSAFCFAQAMYIGDHRFTGTSELDVWLTVPSLPWVMQMSAIGTTLLHCHAWPSSSELRDRPVSCHHTFYLPQQSVVSL